MEANIMTDDRLIRFWSAKAYDTLHWKLGPLNLAWHGSVIEVTEHAQKPKKD